MVTVETLCTESEPPISKLLGSTSSRGALIYVLYTSSENVASVLMTLTFTLRVAVSPEDNGFLSIVVGALNWKSGIGGGVDSGGSDESGSSGASSGIIGAPSGAILCKPGVSDGVGVGVISGVFGVSDGDGVGVISGVSGVSDGDGLGIASSESGT